MASAETVSLVSVIAGSTVALAATLTGLLGQRASDRRRYRQELAKTDRAEARERIDQAARALIALSNELTNVVLNIEPGERIASAGMPGLRERLSEAEVLETMMRLHFGSGSPITDCYTRALGHVRDPARALSGLSVHQAFTPGPPDASAVSAIVKQTLDDGDFRRAYNAFLDAAHNEGLGLTIERSRH